MARCRARHLASSRSRDTPPPLFPPPSPSFEQEQKVQEVKRKKKKITLPFERRVKRVKRFLLRATLDLASTFFVFSSFHSFPQPGKSLRKHWLDRATLQPRLRSLRFLNTKLRAWMIPPSVCQFISDSYPRFFQAWEYFNKYFERSL